MFSLNIFFLCVFGYAGSIDFCYFIGRIKKGKIRTVENSIRPQLSSARVAALYFIRIAKEEFRKELLQEFFHASEKKRES